MLMKLYCVGAKNYMYPGKTPAESSFDEENDTCEKTILCCIAEYEFRKFKIEIELETIYTWCGSGYTTATYGNMYPYKVHDFGPLTHVPKDHKRIELKGVLWDTEERDIVKDPKANVDLEHETWFHEDDLVTNIFTYSADGGDSYYPSGGCYVDFDLFEELPRAFNCRPVWIFYGDSASGKSTLAHFCSTDVEVYETDSAENGVLPDEIWADIIVVGNKWKDITYETVIEKLPEDCEVVDVEFGR